MMRRVAPAHPLRAVTTAATALRFGGGGGGDSTFSRPLTETEQAQFALQKNRTVNKVVPGKLFMRHFIAAEQSTVSIENRTMSIIVCVALILGCSVYADCGLTTYNAALGFAFVFLMNFFVLHTHMNLYPAFGAIALLLYTTSG